MQLSFSVLGTRPRSVESLVSLFPDIFWHFWAPDPLKRLANIESYKKNSSSNQVDAHHKEDFQISSTRPVETDGSASVSAKRVPSTPAVIPSAETLAVKIAVSEKHIICT